MENFLVESNFYRKDFLFGVNSIFIEELYQSYLKDKNSVDPSWVEFFEQNNAEQSVKTTSKIINVDTQEFSKRAISNNQAITETVLDRGNNNFLKARFMIQSYRQQGHLLAKLDPLDLEKLKTHQELKLTYEDFGLENALSDEVELTGYFHAHNKCTIRELKNSLEQIYAGSIGAEIAHIENMEEQKWLYSRLETAVVGTELGEEKKKKILLDLAQIESFEQYLHTKFPGAKRFSIEGGETSLISLNIAIEEFAKTGVQEVVLGMAHRGRLSSLVKVMGKPYRALLSEFLGSLSVPESLNVSGDVKYHMGYSSDQVIDGNKIHLSLTPNPSHLEAVNPVVAGKVRAKQDDLGSRELVTGVLIHGDAAFCGQGIVAESLVMSGLKPYDVGGILHIVINNQIGFTANSSDGRVGRYCTEVAKMVGAPILHINGDDVEAVILATQIACEYRKTFKKDVVLDVVCYRKYGHNEGDEPMYTQALMYNVIKNKSTPAQVYARRLQSEKVIDENYYEQLKSNFKEFLDEEFALTENYQPPTQWLEGHWSGIQRESDIATVTGVEQKILQDLADKICNIPGNIDINSKLKKLFEVRIKNIQSGLIDWAAAEQLAFASLLNENIPIRLTGQDSQRGTFSHRHAVLHSQSSSDKYVPLNNIKKDQAPFEVADSNLSEYGVLGFEYGYSLVNPKKLVIWEAQFGDFCNGAQIIFDQFISSAETKWLRLSGLVCLLPNAMEGQGPEHSSARIERFLQLCAEDNMQIVYPTTPASIFHLLRRQVLSKCRKPLIVMSPKSLLRHKLAISRLEEIGKTTSFQAVLDEADQNISAAKVTKLIFCAGKIYYDLLEKRDAEKVKNIAIIRLEQLYPLDSKSVIDVIRKYKSVKSYIWCQEEPKNMGAWSFINPRINDILQGIGMRQEIEFVGRDEAASPAVGSLYVHNKQQEVLLKKALDI